jgi:uncharacterized RDD family membrane protein YckC
VITPPPPALYEGRQGHYAGAVTRLVAFAADVGASWGLYTLGLGAVSLTVALSTGRAFSVGRNQVPTLIVLVVWEFAYFAYQWALSGKTIGMALLGIQVVTADGTRLTPRQAVLRTLALPLSVAIIGLGFIGILVQRERRALHDLVAGTAVVYAWDARAARLRWLARQSPEATGSEGGGASHR